MPMTNAQGLEGQVLTVLQVYSGSKNISLDQMIGRDLGIVGLDGVLILDELEEKFGIDLDPLIQTHTTFLPPDWFDRLRGRKHGPPNADLTVRELIDHIAKETGRDTSHSGV